MRVQGTDRIVRFREFELDLHAGELRRSGIRLPVQGRPLQVLAALVRTPGEFVTNEQLRHELWPADTFVDFEQGIRNAVARLRAVLGDTADRPRFIETVPKRGYRFLGTLTEPVAQPVASAPAQLPRVRRKKWRIALILAASLAAATGAAIWRYRAPGNSPRFRVRSLAVLPLENLSGDSTQEYFADGITDELITALAKVSAIKVISRTSVMQYKGVRSKPLPQIARELGVDAIVEGTLARSGDRVRITAQLIEARTDRHIWADRYERSSRDILLVEDEIARTVAEELSGRVDREEHRRFAARPIDPGAHEAYLQGLYLWSRRTAPALEEAIRCFSEAIEKDPQYALAYAGRASAYGILGAFGLEAKPPGEVSPRARADAERAVQLDETSAEAHTVRAAIRNLYEWDWPGAEAEFRRAIQLNPNYAPARQWYGQYLCNQGRFEECIAETDQAHALDPAYLIAAVDVGNRLYEARRYNEAIAPITKALEFDPDFIQGHRYLGLVREATRSHSEALAEFRKALELSGGSPVDVAALGHAWAVSGNRTEARRAIRKLDELSKQRYASGYGRALIYTALAEHDRALDWLELAFHERSTWMIKLKVDPRLDPLRGDERFADLVRRVGFAP
jgi:TolB-like protein/Tfp pilus assembly protein PilF/DNA-binding winged helix-turn-helix (wHTH) protein